MRRRKPRRAHTAYNNARGDGWILTSLGGQEKTDRGRERELILYYTEGEVKTKTVEIRKGYNGIDRFLQQYLDIGGKIGEYGGSDLKPNTPFEDQPRSVRMERHAPDIYATAGNARGMSETIAIKAARTFGSTWAEKGVDEWADRVQSVGDGRATRIVEAIERNR